MRHDKCTATNSHNSAKNLTKGLQLEIKNFGFHQVKDFLQVFQGSGIGKMEDNSTSADLLSYTTNGSRGGLVI